MGRQLLKKIQETISKESIIKHAKMCIDHKNGMALWSSNICYPGPGHINDHRKRKRRCLGIHPFRFDIGKRWENTVWKNEEFILTENFRQINYLVISLVNPLFSRNFCQNCLRENCRNHTVTLCSRLANFKTISWD